MFGSESERDIDEMVLNRESSSGEDDYDDEYD